MVKVHLTKFEKKLYFIAFCCFLLTFVLKAFGSASVGSLSLSVEKLRYDIDTQEKRNESLVMKVNELTSFDKIKDVVANMGLAYNNDNIIVINK